jgi:hypothetical protein
MPKFEVVTLDNQRLEVQTKAELDYYSKAQSKYVAENTFTATSDERALDRLVLMETLMFRWQTQLASGKDYDGNPLNHAETEAIRKNIKEGAITISNAHKELGLTKEQREKDKAESVQAYINNLLARAKERGVHREEQVDLIINLFMEYSAHVNAFLRADTYERQRLGFPDADSLISWWTETGVKRYKDHDDKWRASSQRYWRKEI